VPALAWIVDVPALEQRLAEAVRYQPQVEIVKEPVDAALTAVCEGRSSSTRRVRRGVLRHALLPARHCHPVEL
jgi:hypothetical protein